MGAARLAARLWRLEHEERGSISVLGLFLFLTCCVVGAAALDVTHFYAARTQLQAAADLAAHAALFNRSRGAAADVAKARAIAAVEAGMAPRAYGHVLTAAHITFGTWSETTRTFAADPASSSAVRVVTGRDAAGGNPVPSFLFRLVGVEQMDVAAAAVFASVPAPCGEGFKARGRADMQSNNSFGNGFCIHSNDRVELNQNNSFETGSTVSMPNTANLGIPASGFRNNPGLEAALRSDRLDLSILDSLAEVAAGVSAMGTPFTPSYLASADVLRVSNGKVAPSNFTSGRAHSIDCSGGKDLTLERGTYRRIVITTNCAVKFGNDVILEDVVISTTNASAKSFSSSSGLQVGRNDSCARGGGVQLLTRGGADFAADLRLYGSQVVALGDVKFAARANGVGVSIVAGGQINGTSNAVMRYCGTGMEGTLQATRLRLMH